MVSNSAYQNTVKFPRAGKKTEISIFIRWFCLKGKLAEQNIYTGVTCRDSKELWKVAANSELCFPIQPTKILWNFLEQARRPKFQISSDGFVWKANCLSRKSRQEFPLQTVKGWRKLQQNLSHGFQFSLPKIGEISWSRRESQNFKFLHLVSSKGEIGWGKNLTQQFSVQIMKGCEKSQQDLNLGFQFSLPKNAEISWSRQEGRNFKFHRLVLAKR